MSDIDLAEAARSALECVCSGAQRDEAPRYYSADFVDHVNDFELRGLEGVGADRRHAERTAKAAQLFATLLESAPDAMVVSDRSGTIVFANSQTERLFGLIVPPIEPHQRVRADRILSRRRSCNKCGKDCCKQAKEKCGADCCKNH